MCPYCGRCPGCGHRPWVRPWPWWEYQPRPIMVTIGGVAPSVTAGGVGTAISRAHAALTA